MNCPDCPDVEMEGEARKGEVWNSPSGGKPAHVDWGAEYFCPNCYASWYWTKALGLHSLGFKGGQDSLARYKAGEVDENGQAW